METIRCLVTGAGGFIGAAVVRRLRANGQMIVRAALRSRTGMVGEETDATIVGSIGPKTVWRDALSEVAVVVHLAARVHVIREEKGDASALFRQVNVLGTERLARDAAAAGVRRFVFVSSVGVHGVESGVRPFVESDALAPSDAYATSKAEAEAILRQVSDETGMEVVIVRPPLVYGLGAPGNFRRLLRLVRLRVPLPFGAVANQRSLIGVENLADFLYTCTVHADAANETFLVSDGDDLSTGELVRRMAIAMGRRPASLPVPTWLLMSAARILGRRETARRLLGSLQINMTKARSVLGWSPPCTVNEELCRACAVYR